LVGGGNERHLFDVVFSGHLVQTNVAAILVIRADYPLQPQLYIGDAVDQLCDFAGRLDAQELEARVLLRIYQEVAGTCLGYDSAVEDGTTTLVQALLIDGEAD